MFWIGHTTDDPEFSVEHPCRHGHVETVLVRWETDDDPCCVRNPGGDQVLIFCSIPLDVKNNRPVLLVEAEIFDVHQQAFGLIIMHQGGILGRC